VPHTRADPAARTLAVNPDKLTVRSVITSIDPDRSGDVVVPTGLRNADEFLLNPVVLWAHQRLHVPPIGVCEWIDIQPRRIVAQTRFARGVPFAEDVFRLYEQGVLRGWSIGFIPRKTRKMPMVNGNSPTRGLRIEEWDLLEYSAVPIPENPAAVTVAIEKGLVRDPVLCDWLVNAKAAADVLADLIAPAESFRHSE
jgi:phage head maturation protease